jgi:hypothetical protein
MCLVSFYKSIIKFVELTYIWSYKFNSEFEHILYGDEQKMCNIIKSCLDKV